MQALTMYRAILASAHAAPTKEQRSESKHVPGYHPDQNKAMAYYFQGASDEAWGDGYVIDEACCESISEQLETSEETRWLAPSHVTFKHANGRIKLANVRERLLSFAADMLKGSSWALWGGGEKPAMEKPARLANPWKTASVKLVAEQWEDGHKKEATDLALSLGGVAYGPHSAPWLIYAPMPVLGGPEWLRSGYMLGSGWVCFHAPSGLRVRLFHHFDKSRAAAEKNALEKLASQSETDMEKTHISACGEAVDPELSLSGWRAAHGFSEQVDEVAIDAFMTSHREKVREERATQEEPEWSKKWQSDMEEALREIEAMKAQREQSKPATIPAPAEPIHAPAAVDPALSEALHGLAMYGADMNPHGFIRKGEKTTSVQIVEKKGRYRYVGNGGNGLATSPATADGVCGFVESFWFWKKTESTQAIPPVDVIGGALANGGHVVGDSLRTANGQHLKTLSPAELATIPAEKITPVAEHVARVNAYIAAIEASEVGDMSDAIAAIDQAQGVATAEQATVCAADPAHAVGSVGIGAAIPADSTPAQKTTERSPQADHLAARADVAQLHAEQASEAPGVGGGEGRPFENEISPSDFLGDVPLSLAIQAHSGTSLTPEKRGASVQTSYAHVMAQDYKEMHAQAVRGGTLDLLPEVFARYRARQAGAYRAYLASSSRIVSSFIAGPSNFPAARMNKRADIAHRRLTEYLDGGETPGAG